MEGELAYANNTVLLRNSTEDLEQDLKIFSKECSQNRNLYLNHL